MALGLAGVINLVACHLFPRCLLGKQACDSHCLVGIAVQALGACQHLSFTPPTTLIQTQARKFRTECWAALDRTGASTVALAAAHAAEAGAGSGHRGASAAGAGHSGGGVGSGLPGVPPLPPWVGAIRGPEGEVLPGVMAGEGVPEELRHRFRVDP